MIERPPDTPDYVWESYTRQEAMAAKLKAQHPEWKVDDEELRELAVVILGLDDHIKDATTTLAQMLYGYIKHLVGKETDLDRTWDLAGNAFYYVSEMELAAIDAFERNRDAYLKRQRERRAKSRA